MKNYNLRYIFKHETKKGGFTKEEILERDHFGGCDAILCISIIYPEDGSYSQSVFSIDGKEKRPLTQREIFKVWLTLGISLHDKGELKGWQKDFVEVHTDTIREVFRGAENEKEK